MNRDALGSRRFERLDHFEHRLIKSQATFARLLLACAVLVCAAAAQGAELKIAGEAAVLMEMRTGKILWQRNKDLSMAPASTTKIMTALIVLERNKLSDIAIVPAEATSATGGTAKLQRNERLAVEQLLFAMLIGSANDAAVTLAKHTAGSVAKFVGMMNDKARGIGALQSSFRNPTGLPQKGQITTARDLAVITRAALQQPEFRRIVAVKKHPWKSAEWQGELENSNDLLNTYPGAIGVKTGNTREAGFCLVGAAARGAETFIAVILKSSEENVWQDARILLDHGFKNFSAMSLVEPGKTILISKVGGRKVDIAAAAPAHYVGPAHDGGPPQIQIALDELELPIAKGEIVGEAVFRKGDKEFARVDLISRAAVQRRPFDLPWLIAGVSALLLALFLFWRRRHRRRKRYIFAGRGSRLRL